MFLAQIQSSSSKERFSLLSLNPDEIYYNDFGVLYVRPHAKTQTTELIKGRLKICSQSLIFDTKILAVPIIKFPIENIKSITIATDPWTEGNGYAGKTINIETNLFVEMKENNVISPYKFKEEEYRGHLFVLTHSSPDDCLPLMQQLHRAALAKTHGDITDGKFMVQAITLSISYRMKFDLTHLVDGFERPVLEMDGIKIRPLVKNPGKILLTQTRLYFQAFNNIEGTQILIVKLSNIKSVRRRRVLMRHIGLEVTSNNQHIFLQLHNMADRDQLCTHIASMSDAVIDCTDEKNVLLKWQTGEISNYEYLEYLNSVADRSYNDLTQYPVFPWIVKDYTSSKLDLNNPDVYRDLSKPIGALNQRRLNELRERYEDMPEPKFLYGSHYSTPGDVLFYLARAAPEYTLCLHNGKFDQADRMFRSVADTWDNLMKSTSDFKELIPEFYQTEQPGFFLNNYLNINFGSTQDGEKIGDVILPPWAENSRDFVLKLREALESDYVSANLHHWIDLIFGYKQRGEEAYRANNVFYHLTYEGAVDLDSLDPNERESIENQISEFGQTPRQLFFSPHPARYNNKQEETSDELTSKAYDILMADKIRDVTATSEIEEKFENVTVEEKDKNENVQKLACSGVTSARFRRGQSHVGTSSSAPSMGDVERDETTASLLSSLAQLRQVARHNLHHKK